MNVSPFFDMLLTDIKDFFKKLLGLLTLALLAQMINRFFSYLRKNNQNGTFIRNVSILSFWNVLTIIVQLVLSPIVTRLYSPSEYGVFALISSLVVPITIIGSFRYSEAIVICKTNQERNSIVLLSLCLITVITIIVFLVVLLGRDYFLNIFGGLTMSNIIFLIPVIICFSSICDVLLFLNQREKKFSVNGSSSLAMNLLSRISMIGYSFIIPAQAVGLILGDLLGKLAAITLLLGSIKQLGNKFIYLIRSFRFLSLKYVAYIYRRFPFYVMPANLINSISGNLPIYFFKEQHFTFSAIGAFALANSLLEIINRLLPYSVASIFFQKAVELKKKSMQELKGAVYKLYGAMLIASLIIFTFAALLAEIVFPFVFGKSWIVAGVFVSLLSIQYAFNFVSMPIAEVLKVIEKQRFLFVSTIFSMVLRVIVLFILILYETNEKESIFWFSVANAIGSIIPIIGIFYFLQFKLRQVIESLIAVLVFFLGIVFFINFR